MAAWKADWKVDLLGKNWVVLSVGCSVDYTAGLMAALMVDQ